MDRREFMVVGLAATSGLCLGLRPAGTDGLADASFEANAFLRVDRDGMVTFTAPVPEMGQGVRTSLAMVAAEELDVDWRAVRIEQADADETRYGPRQRAAGSHTLLAYWRPMRVAGASARAMLVAAAATQWKVSTDACVTEDGRVHHRASQRSVSYGELVDAASRQAVPLDPPLKRKEQFRRVGTETRGADVPAIVTGRITFGLDTRVPGMRFAAIARCPVFGGRPRSVDAAETRRMEGVRDVIEIEPQGPLGRPFLQGGVAVIADSTWEALRGRDALRIDWDLGPNASESSTRLEQVAGELLDRPGRVVFQRGDPAGALAAATRRVEALYTLPLLAHAPLEPMNCLAHVTPSACELWTPSQIPAQARAMAARVSGLPAEAVMVHITRIGGAFGRRLAADYVAEAVHLSNATGVPIQVVWSRVDDMKHGFFRPYSRHRMFAALDARGALTAWVHRLASTSRYAFRPGEDPAASEVRATDFPVCLLPTVGIEYHSLESSVLRGPWRAPRDNSNVFVVESFLDEIATASGRDPLALRLELLGEPRRIPTSDDAVEQLDTGRLRRVLERATAAADWGRPLPEGRARGLAANFSYRSYVAEVAEVALQSGAWRVARVTVAVDGGIPVNPLGIRAQVEGAVIDGLSTLHRAITFEEGRVQQSSFSDYHMMRIDEPPEIDVHILDSDEPPTGMGEPPFPPLAPAVTNALFAATGVRHRTLPLPERLGG